MTVTQWHRNQIIRGLWLLAKQKLKMDSCLRGAILNLTAFCSIWTLIEECSSIKQGRIQDFKLGGALFGVFRVKNHDFAQKKIIFSQNFRGDARRVLHIPVDYYLSVHNSGEIYLQHHH